MKKSTYSLAISMLIVFLGISLYGADVQAYLFDSPQKLIIPFYNYPTWWNSETYLWDDLADANTLVPITAIINPNNGPESCPPNSDYQRGISDLHQAGVTILGYVYTSYGMRAIQEVQADVDIYFQCYNIDGIFFDEASSAPENVSYYQTLYDYVQAQQSGATVVNNFGVEPHQDYFSIGSSLLGIFEDELSEFLDWTPPEWVEPERSVVFIHNTSADEIQSVLDHLRDEDMGWFYATSDVLPNPWDTLPSYFGEILSGLTLTVPEPATIVLVGISLLILLKFVQKKK